MAFGLSKKSGVGLYQSPSQRKDNSKIFLFKSLSGLKRKDKLYAIGYNLTSAAAILPGFDAGMLGAAPYFIGQLSNNAASIKKAFQGDLSALTGRGRFLGGASFVNRAAGSITSALSSPTGVGAVDRAANIYVGQQKAAFLHYTRNMGKKEQLKVFVEAIGDGKVFDKEVQKQAQLAVRGNVFAKWKALTYYKAIKTAPDPWRDNPYIQAREARRNQQMKQKKFRKTVVSEPHTANTDAHVLKLMNMSDSMFQERDAIEATAKLMAIDDLLTAEGVTFKKSSNSKEIMKQFGANEKFRNQKFRQKGSDKFDNLTYRSLLDDVQTPEKKSTLGFRGANAERLKRTKGLETNPDTNQFTTNLSKEIHDKAFLSFLNSNNTFNSFKGDSAAEILKLATNIPANPEVIQAFNNYATKMGRVGMNLSDGAGMGQITQGIFSVLFSGNMSSNETSSTKLAADLSRDFSALQELTGEIGRAGFEDIADDVLNVIDPKKVLRTSGAFSETSIPSSHFMEARKELIQVKSDYNQNFQYGSVFNEADRHINNFPNNDIRLTELNLTDSDVSGLDDYIENKRRIDKRMKKYPISKRDYMENSQNSRRKRAEIAKNVMKANMGDLGIAGSANRNNDFIDEFVNSVAFKDVKMHSPDGKPINTDEYGKRMNQKLEREITKFIEDGVPTEQILNHVEKEFKKSQKNYKKQFNTKIPPVTDYDDFSTHTPDKFESGNEVRRGQSTFVNSHNNYVPSQKHIIESIHMHNIELNGKSEEDGSGFVFREQVSFGGQNEKSQTADKIRDAVSIEFGGPATDTQGKLKNRGDRMFYLPSFFIGTAASEAAAFLGIFDKGSTFKASASKAGIHNAVFRMSDEGTGVFNATRKKFNEKKRMDFEGQRRVSKMFADAKKSVSDHRKANFSNEGVRLANQRAMTLFKKGGGFGQINIDDVSKNLSIREQKMFGIVDGGLQTGTGPSKNKQFNLNKLGGFKNANSKIQMKPGGSTSKTYSDGTSNFNFLTGSFESPLVENVFRNRDGNISVETGYTPLVPMVFDTAGHALSKGHKTPKTRVAETLRGTEKGKAAFQGAQNAESVAAQVELAMSGFDSNINIQAIIANPYEAMQKTFVLGTKPNGTGSIWHTNDLGKDTQNPNHPINRMREMFFGAEFETELIRQFVRTADSEASPVIQLLIAQGKIKEKNELLRALRVQAGFVAKTYSRVTGQTLQAMGNQILTEDAFRSLTMTLAVLLEANKEHFKFEMHKRLRRATQGIKMDSALMARLNANLAKETMSIDVSKEFDEIERLLGQGIAFGYDENGTPGFVTFSGAQGFRKEFELDDNLPVISSLMPDFAGGNATGRQIGKIYNFDSREDAILSSLGVSDFQEIRWDKSLRLGMQDVGADGRFLRGERWSIAQELAEDTGISASHFMNDNSEMVNAIMNDSSVADKVGNQIAAFTTRMQAGKTGELSDAVVAKEIAALDAFLEAKGMGNRTDRYNTIKTNFGFIVAEKKRGPAVHNDETHLKANINILDKKTALAKAKNKIRMLGSSSGVGSGAKAGRQVADDLYDAFMEQTIDDIDIAAILAAGAHNASSQAEAADFLKNFYQSMAFLSPHQGISRVPISLVLIDAKMERIFRMNLPSAYQLKQQMDIRLWTDSAWLGLAKLIRKTDYDPNLLNLNHTGDFVKHSKTVKKSRRGNVSLHKTDTGRAYYKIKQTGKESYKEYISFDKNKFYIEAMKLRNQKKRYDK